ncbi:sensor histidine kinase [Mucilaginibacter auburnensis]|uniref:histidine kinase n=1 Tax=Mucilaginibacter auburnensis TaxID=1457233 RepID=A0A2H9VNS4_9SPHI|nr:HAMP domain-containing sensor histidine kinase [Mucilaginibacter auburnensis]PJJ79994.1 signal transduction histidine kinase [Mucilaginibacter auburnensis]
MAIKVRDRLVLQFTLMFGILLSVVFIFIYVFLNRSRAAYFFYQLDERAVNVAEFYLAQDNVSPQKFKEVQKKFPRSLTNETFRIYDQQLKPVLVSEDSIRWSRKFLSEVDKKGTVHFYMGNKQVAGMRYADNSGKFIFVVSALDKKGLDSMERLKEILFLAFFASLIITFFMGRFFARISLSPIISIRNDLLTIKANDLHRRLPISKIPKDEIDELCLSINQLLEHLQQSFENQQTFVANSSHELRTPLTSILGQAETTLVKERTPEEYQAALREIIESVVKLKDIITSLMELVQSNMDIGGFEKIRMDELIWEIADEFMLKYGEDKLVVRYELHDADTGVIYGNRRLLFISINNLLENALKFSDGKAPDLLVTDDSDRVILTIADEGIGIETDEIDKIFQPFYRSKKASKFPGSGIGLSLSQNIFKLHNALVAVQSEVNRGTVFTIAFNKLRVN